MSPELGPLSKEALAWVVRLHSGAATAEDAELLKQWRSQSLEHEQAFREAVKLWRTFGDATRGLAEEQAPAGQSVLSQSAHLIASRRAVLGGAIAASVAAYCVVKPPLGLWPSFQELSADYRTAKGEQRELALSQTVSLRLNTQTSISVSAKESDPLIELISGEAAISARRMQGSPLTVKAADGLVTAMQAEFNARCLDGVVSVSCTNGEVVVAASERNVRLPKGQQVSYDAGGLGLPKAIDTDQATAWQRGLLIVRDRALADVVDEVNRYRPGKIIVMNSRLGRRMITGTFHLDQFDDFIGQVRGLFGATVQPLPGGVILLS